MTQEAPAPSPSGWVEPTPPAPAKPNRRRRLIWLAGLVVALLVALVILRTPTPHDDRPAVLAAAQAYLVAHNGDGSAFTIVAVADGRDAQFPIVYNGRTWICKLPVDSQGRSTPGTQMTCEQQ